MLGGQVFITVHGARRARARLGLKRRAVPRAVDTAWRYGALVHHHRFGARLGAVAKSWRGAVWIFAEGPGGPSLVTVLIPSGEVEERISWQMHIEAQQRREQQRKRMKQRKRRA